MGFAGITDECEECSQVREPGSLGSLLRAVADLRKEGEDFFRRDGSQIPVAELGREPGQKEFIAGDRIFFVNWPGGNSDNTRLLC